MSSYIYLLTLVHTAISLVALVLGWPVISGFLHGRVSTWTFWFLVTAIACSVTGFLFPITVITPGIVFGIIALVTLAIALYARRAHYAGHLRWIYVATMVLNVYLLLVVTIVQSFQKIPFLNALAPTGAEPPVLIAQVIGLVAFLVLGVFSVIKFKGEFGGGVMPTPA
ncbi:hypothetical protein [Flaviflagellibacter deserti]|jgi:hypothetical protein|uniref:Membrane protein DUF2306 n=1 Tax=Flaviflagellibacter deserti TaxID=2267266 RepID=A0ABV9Z2A0_9HYPH